MVKDNSLSSKILDIVIYVSLILLIVITLYPIIYILSVSLSSSEAYESGRVVFLPVDFNLDAYKVVFKAGTVPRSLLNSVIYTLMYTFVALLLTTSMAYPLSRAKERVPFKGFFSKLVVFTMFFSAGIVPNYLVVKYLGLMNSMWSLILPVAVTTYNLVVMRSFFEGIPIDLEEAAFIDGANEIVIFFKIMLPQAKPFITAIAITTFISQWNNYNTPFLYLDRYPTMALGLYDFQQKQLYGTQMAPLFAGIILSVLPVAVLFTAMQKTIMENTVAGGIKG